MKNPALSSLAIAVIGLALVLSRIDCGGTYPTLEGPGLTLDEVFNVEQGVYLTESFKLVGFDAFTMSGAAQVFDDTASYNPDHPPLGRICLGVVHQLVKNAAPGKAAGLVNIAAARVASALAFAATLFLITCSVARKVNLTAGIAAGTALLMMPRVVGHAHLGSLETFIGFFYTATILAAGRTADKGHRSDTARVVLAGVLMGLALLTKIQAIFLPAAIVPWMLLTRKFGGVRSSIVLCVTAGVCFVALWPWLWLEPIDNISSYLGRTTDRQTVYNYYLGTRYASPPLDDTTAGTPWHFALVTFFITIPVGLHLLGVGGVFMTLKEKLRDWQGAVLFGAAVPLAAFTVAAPVYDGARLFLVSYPLWAILIGVAFSAALEYANKQRSKLLRTALFAGFALQSIGTFTSAPYYLSYYNLAVGGTAGANSLGMERSYWGEAATKSFWEKVPEGSTVYVAPVLDMYRLASLKKYTPIIQQRNIKLEPFKYELEKQPGLLLVLHRRAEAEWVHDYAATKEPIAQVTFQGVPLATLVENDGTPFKSVRILMNDEDLVSKYQDEAWELPCAEGDAIGESLREPHRTVCILSLAHAAIQNGGVVSVFAVALDATPFTAITDAYIRIGCKREADIILEAVDLLGFANMDFDTRYAYIFDDHIKDVLAKLEPFNDRYYERDIVEQKLADWIRLHQNDQTVQE